MRLLIHNRKNDGRSLLAWKTTPKTSTLGCTLVAAFCILVCECAFAQRPRFPDFFQSQPVQARPVQFQSPSGTPPVVTQNNGLPTLGTPTFSSPTIINSPPIITTTPPSTFLQQPGALQQPGVVPAPAFDPFQSNSTPFPSFGGVNSPSTGAVQVNPQGSTGLILPQNIQVVPPAVQTQQVQPNGQFPVFPQNQDAFGTFNQSPTRTGGTNWWPSAEWPSQAWATLRDDWIPRVLERPRFRYTYISGNGSSGGDELGINEAEVATTLTIANFAGGTQALRISPGFVWDFLSGPDTAVTGAELPSRVYSAYIATDFISDPAAQAGVETNVAIGFYSDFDNVSSNSWRITGTALGWWQVNSFSTAKLGIEYYDRVDIKLLPAVGVFMAPTPDVKFDVYFPRPKLAQRIQYFDRYEGWAYVGAEYGGGSWAVELTGPIEDQVDINDVRAFVGAEWVGPRSVTGFFEFGYVFERNLVYRSAPAMKIKLEDAYMVRTGIAF